MAEHEPGARVPGGDDRDGLQLLGPDQELDHPVRRPDARAGLVQSGHVREVGPPAGHGDADPARGAPDERDGPALRVLRVVLDDRTGQQRLSHPGEPQRLRATAPGLHRDRARQRARVRGRGERGGRRGEVAEPDGLRQAELGPEPGQLDAVELPEVDVRVEQAGHRGTRAPASSSSPHSPSGMSAVSAAANAATSSGVRAPTTTASTGSRRSG